VQQEGLPTGQTSGAFTAFLRRETAGGVLLVAAALLALAVANSPLSAAYEGLRELEFGPRSLDLHLDVAAWTAEGLLVVFFYVSGVEVKRELTVGELAHWRAAALPMIAAAGGMIVPALIFLAVAAGSDGASRGWAIPVATDIAFALGVLALVARVLPPGVRVLLLSLAVVDDIIAIALVAVLFTQDVAGLPLLLAAVGVAVFAGLQRARVTAWWLYLPLAVTVWALVHASGVHATVAGVLLGLCTRVRRDEGEAQSQGERMERLLQPFTVGIAVPLFAFFSVGVVLSPELLADAASNRAAVAAAVALVLGKFLGVVGGTVLAVKTGVGRLPPGLLWRDVAVFGLLAGCGFTVSLLVTELAFTDAATQAQVKVGVFVGSLIAAGGAAALAKAGARGRIASTRVDPPGRP
jgi:NhaA family Na+:H+ antiporter